MHALQLTPRQRATWTAHVAKAALRQHHGELEQLFKPFVPEDAVVMDVGAHAGQFTKLFARMARTGKVYAVEPSLYARSILRPALAWNRIRNVRVLPMGLSDAPGAAVLYTPLTPRGSLGYGRAHLRDGPQGDAHMVQTTALQTLDAMVEREGIGRLDFIKVDVEGWEVQVIKGGLDTIARFKPALFLEVSAEWLTRGRHTPDDLWALLQPFGYVAQRVEAAVHRMPATSPAARYLGAGDYLFRVPGA
ncbi:MAG: FkbM family methyltransferase [Caulobacteraceae bacterium]